MGLFCTFEWFQGQVHLSMSQQHKTTFKQHKNYSANNKSQKWISKVWKKEKKDGTNILIHGRQKRYCISTNIILSLTNFATWKKLTISTFLEIL